MKVLTFLLFFSIASPSFFCCQDDEVIVKIDNLSEEQSFDVPLKVRKGWVTRSFAVIDNTAEDSVRLGPQTFIAPKWTGILYWNDEYNVKPTTFKYKPLRPTAGSITLKWSVSY